MPGWDDLAAKLAHAYVIVREVPRAAGFTSYEAKSRKDGSAVDIKTVPASVLAGASPLRETDFASRRVQHPNILPLLSYGFADEHFYWVTPAIDGRTLRSRLDRGGRIEPGDSLTVLRDVAAALTHAHLHGVIHGGLTPDSIIISGGSALVTDLGIQEVFAALRRAGSKQAAPLAEGAELLRYASPEQSRNGMADARADAYAWGVVAYELLGGRHPFVGRNTPNQIVAAHSDEAPPPLGAANVDAPGAVTRLIMRCLSKAPENRPESAREIFAVLTREMLVPPPPPPAGTGQRITIVLLAGVLLVILAIAWLGLSGP